MTTEPLALAGGHGSPYSLKMRAVLRYRHIPFRWVPRDSKWDDLPEPPVRLIPMLAWPDGDGGYRDVMVDSSPQIMRLEQEHQGRSVVPPDPALAFLDHLIEDFADEWLTKAMYHYRWAYDADIDKAGKLLPVGRNLQMTSDQGQQMYGFITARQIGRRELVGSTELNTPIIEASYLRVLDIIQRQLAQRDFFLGDRPGRGDFGLYGQLTQLVAWDPTPMALAATRAPKVIGWVHRLDDVSWLPVEADEGWASADSLDPGVTDLLTEVGRTYAPFMLANAQALMSGADEVVCQIDGETYRQGPFKYQGKCLQWLREAYTALGDDDRGRVDAALAGTGCEVLVA
ncbi:MAG: glutathione S-transferase N-terminal domain-containing protein [Actinomycetota bacterium]